MIVLWRLNVNVCSHLLEPKLCTDAVSSAQSCSLTRHSREQQLVVPDNPGWGVDLEEAAIRGRLPKENNDPGYL